MWNERLFFDRNIDFVRLFDYNMKCYEFTDISFGGFYEIFIGERNVGAWENMPGPPNNFISGVAQLAARLLW